MDIQRIARHLFSTGWRVGRVFPPASLVAIENAIRAGETTHAGEIRFAVEASLDGLPLLRGQSARERAIEVFSALRVWDTEANNGVLIYLLLADREVEIIADRGIHARVGAQGWETICRVMEECFRRGEFERGVRDGIAAVAGHLAADFPPRADDVNELPDAPVRL